MAGQIVPTDITIYPAGQESIRILAKEVLTFDLRLGGYTLAEMLSYSNPLPAPKEMRLTVTYTDGTVRQWHLERARRGDRDMPNGVHQLELQAEGVRELTG